MKNTIRFALIALVGAAACGSEKSVSPTPTLTTVDVTLGAPAVEVGQNSTVSAVGLDQYATPIVAGEPVFSSSDPNVAEVDAKTGTILGISSGTAQIFATIGSRSGQRTISVAFPPMITINEIKSNDDGPGGWVELYNPTNRAVELSGWKVSNEHVLDVATLPAGTTIASKGYLVLDESVFPRGISKLGGVHIFSRFNVIIDDPFWDTPIATTIGRCPDGTGDLIPLTAATKGTANVCPQARAR